MILRTSKDYLKKLPNMSNSPIFRKQQVESKSPIFGTYQNKYHIFKL